MGQIVAKHVCVKIDRRDILMDVSVHFGPGLHYLIGLNGSGKTTLLSCLQGFQAFEGEVLLDGENISHLSALQRARQIAVVQQHVNIPFQVTVYDFVLMGRFPYLNWLGNYRKEDHEIVQGQLEALEISHLSPRFLNQISGGELQKVFLSRALCQQTPVLLLDEPAQSLDPRNKRILYQQLEALAAGGKTIVCATHDLFPLRFPDAHVIAIRQGRLILDQNGGLNPEAVFNTVYGE